MSGPELESALGPILAGAFRRRGYAELTAVQRAVLDPSLAGRDLRISSQTGSGKTVALGLAIRDLIAAAPNPPAAPNDQEGASPRRMARPRAIAIAPTRELAKQVEDELGWLFEPFGAGVVSVTGGASYRDEQRALASQPAVVVATPGRLLDHLRRGTIDAQSVGAVVLDEADRLLDMGFREDLEAIFGFTPKERLTHLVSATFAAEVRSLANSVQRDPAHVEGTRLGEANLDIEHVVHVIEARARLDALVNLLLAEPDAQTLVFARTRADVANLTSELLPLGFAVSSLSGEMDQRARERAMEGFRSGNLHVLVATDVAARGIDVQDIGRVIHLEPPNDADTYTHRSGRTGRAGRKGKSIVLTTPAAMARTRRLLREAGVSFRFGAIPTSAEIKEAAARRVFEELTAPDPEGFAGFDDSVWKLARELAEAEQVPRVVARLLLKTRMLTVTEPRNVRTLDAQTDRPNRSEGGVAPHHRSYVPFRITWGKEHGADARRVLAVVCRRGGIRGQDVGAIRIGARHALVEVAADVAASFEHEAAKPDPRDPRLRIQRERSPREGAPSGPPARHEHPHGHEPRRPRADEPAARPFKPTSRARGRFQP